MSGPSRRGWLAALLVLFAALAGGYSLFIPLFEGPDEVWHFALADHLADGGDWPRLSAEQPDIWLRNAAHPPLYYWAAAALIDPLDRSDFPGAFHFNLASPNITPGSVSDRPNTFIHTAREDFPYRQTALAVHAARLLSVALGVVTLVGVYTAARRLLPTQPDLALWAAALAGLVPQFVYGSAVLNNDALAAAAGAWLLVAAIALSDSAAARWALAGGVALGAALLTKAGGLVLLPMPALALALWLARGRPGWRLRLPRALAAVVLAYGFAALLAGWWFLRNWRLYDDPLAWREWQALAGLDRTGVTPARLLADMPGLFGTFWADLGLRLDEAGAVWGFAALVLLAGVGLAARWRRRDWPALHGPGLIMAAVALALLLASALRLALVVTDIHGRLLHPGLAAVGVALALGLTGLAPPGSRWRALPAGLAVAALAAFNLAAPLTFIRPAYARPVVAALPAGAVPSGALYGGQLSLVGYLPPGPDVPNDGDLRVTTFWRLVPGAEPASTAVPEAGAWLTAALVQPDGAVIGQGEALLGSSVYPTFAWTEADIVATAVSLEVVEQAGAPTVADVWLSVRGPSGELWPVAAGGGEAAAMTPGDYVIAGRVRIGGAECPPGTPSDAVFDGGLRLESYQVSASGVTLCWAVSQPPSEDYTVFVHILDQDGQLLDTADSMPRGGNYPTTAWIPGEVVPDFHDVVVPPGALVQVGLYRAGDGSRLALNGGPETALSLAP